MAHSGAKTAKRTIGQKLGKNQSVKNTDQDLMFGRFRKKKTTDQDTQRLFRKD